MTSEGGLANLMLGSQLVCKSIRSSSSPSPSPPKEQTNSKKNSNMKSSNNGTPSAKQQESPQATANKQQSKQRQQQQQQQQSLSPKSQSPSQSNNSNSNSNSNSNNNNNNNNHITESQQKQMQKAEKQQTNQKQQQVAPESPNELHQSSPEADSGSSLSCANAKKDLAPSAKEFEQLTKETQEMKIKTRKLQLEIDEKNEIISVLRDELETTKELSDKFQRDNIQLLKDSKRVKFLQDENDFLQDKVGSVDKLELELKRLKEKLAELDFLKLRIGELEEDKSRAQEESAQFEDKWRRAEQGLTRVVELEAELERWKSFSQELENERNIIKTKLLESIDQEAKLNLVNKKVEDEVRRLRSMIRSLEEEREEEQASNSLIMNASDLKQMNQHGDSILEGASNAADSSIKFELEKQIEKGLTEENRNLKQKLDEQEVQLSGLVKRNCEICDELDGNRKLISDLRQDLACEKNLAQKLTRQLSSFERQIKNLDKQYFHSHENEVKEPTTGGLSGEEESSLVIKSVTSTKSGERKEAQDALLKSERKCVNRARLSYNGEGEGISMHNETVLNEETKEAKPRNGCKLSAHSKQVDEVAKQKSQTQLDNSKSGDGWPQKQATGDLLKLATSAEQTKAETPVVTNKSSATLEISNNLVKNEDEHKNKDKDKDRTHSEGVPLSAPNNYNLNAAREQKLEAQHEPLSGTLSLKPLIDSQDGLKMSSIKNVAADHGKCNIASVKSIHFSTSCSSSSSLSPSAPVTVGHDSGFQSINNDFNQISPPNSRTSCVSPVSLSKSTTAAAATVGSDAKLKVENGALDAKRSTPLPADQSMPIDSSKQLVASASPSSSSSSAQATVSPVVNSATPTQSKDKVPNGVASLKNNPLSGQQKQLVNGSQVHKSGAADKARSSPPDTATSSSTARSISATNKQRDEKLSDIRNKQSASQSNKEDHIGDVLESERVRSERSKSRSNFVRNSMSSRSVNFGHLSRSSYFDKIRASVTATATTNTTSSFNEHQTQNILVAQAPKDVRQQQPHNHHVSQPYQTHNNCSLNHQHINDCYTAKSNQIAQLHPHYHHFNHHPHHQQPHTLITEDGVRSSRQLNALIDSTVSNVQQQQVGPHSMLQQASHGLPIDTPGLTEQQMAHLAHQHYYHHLEHMRQLHQMHHQHHLHLHHHRMHHKYQQQQQQQQQQTSAPASGNASGPSQSSISPQHQHQSQDGFVNQSFQSNPTQVRQREPMYTGGSQFYAPSMQLEQVYANMNTNNNINQANERTRLANNTSNSIDQAKSSISDCSRSSPNKLQQQHYQNIRIGAGSVSSHKNQAFNQCALPQIDEVNGPQSVQNSINDQLCKSRTTSSQPTANDSGKVLTNGRYNDMMSSSSNNASPSSNSTSPTSSNSSNLSPSSASSSSSLNSLTASNSGPLNRSALRHSTSVEPSRRQFSVERDLSNNVPTTATLSRVGSCRLDGRPIENHGAYVVDHHQNHQSTMLSSGCDQNLQNISATQMRTPIRSSPLQSSQKILNSSQKSSAQSPSRQEPTRMSQQQQLDHLAQRRSSLKGSSVVSSGHGSVLDNRLVNNLAGIKLNDSLAFTSLRMPKGSPRASGLNCSLDRQVLSGKGQAPSTFMQAASKRSASSSSSPEKQQLANATNQTSDQASNKSSVWFEYGCV